MIKVDGIQPKLDGHNCEALICQQYWYNGKLSDEVDVLFIKADGRCHQLYFENGIVFWRIQQEMPRPFDHKNGDKFAYPFVDLGEKYQLQNRLITGLSVQPLPEGVTVSIEFENGGELILYHQDNRTQIRRITG